MHDTILPGSRVMVFDPWANGRKGYWRNEGEYRPATVLCRYGFISERIERECGREAAKYPDVIDVLFDHSRGNLGPVSNGHFTDLVRVIVDE